MVNSNVPDIAVEPSKCVSRVQKKFRLELSEEDAVRFFESLIGDSVTAVMAVMIETVHRWAQYFRR